MNQRVIGAECNSVFICFNGFGIIFIELLCDAEGNVRVGVLRIVKHSLSAEFYGIIIFSTDDGRESKFTITICILRRKSNAAFQQWDDVLESLA